MNCPIPGCPHPARIEQDDGSRLCWTCATRAAGRQVVPPAPPKIGNRPHTAKPWTTAEEDRLRAMWERGVKVADIAKKLGNGRTEDGVSRHAHTIGLPRRKPGPPRQD